MIVRSFFIFFVLFNSYYAHALQGIGNLEQRVFESNQEVLALKKQNESKETLYRGANSGFYPTLNVTGGFGKVRTDDKVNETGYSGYLDGNLNLFRGFKDQAIIAQRKVDQKLSFIELELKKREIQLNLIELVSEVISLHKLQSILAEEYKATQIQKQMAAKKVSAGLTGSVDNFEIDLRETEIKIEQTQIDQRHFEIHQKFIKLFGEDVTDSELGILDFSKMEILTQLPSAELNLESTLEVQQAYAIEEKADLEQKEIKSEFLPSVDLTYNFGRLTPSEGSPLKFDEYKYGLMITIPLFSGMDTLYKTRAATLAAQYAEKIKFQKKFEIQSEYNILKAKLNELKTIVGLNEQKLISAQKYFDLTLAEYKRGIKNSPDLVGATERLFASKKKKVELMKELELLRAKFGSYNTAT
jgi:outer membrane protein TolC